MRYDLSILIPSRNEEWLAKTVEDILKNKRGKTEVLIGLDGQWADPGIPDHEDVRLIYYPESIGQRAMQNRLAQISTAKYVAKTDAHCAFDEGFDVKLMEVMEDDMTIVPVMKNLHIFDWVCYHCSMRYYQGPEPEECRNETCSFEPRRFYRDVVWIAKSNPQSSAYRFNKNLQFKYFPELRAKQSRSGLQETMSLQGSFFMATRQKYWELKLCDESWGSWGQQGTEVALKTWLSGGRVMCHMDTWYAHLFRTQKGFDHPFPIGSSQHNARKISRQVFLEDGWEKGKHPISWLLDKFWYALKDVNDTEAKWEKKDLDELRGKALPKSDRGIIYYTDNQLKLKIARRVQKQLLNIADQRGIPLVSASLKPMTFGKNVVVKGERGTETYFRQIVTALENLDTDIVFFCEHDVLYHPSHFDFTPPDNLFYYNQNVWRVRTSDGKAVTWEANQVAELCCNRELALAYYRTRLKEVQAGKFNRSYEPGGRDKNLYGVWFSKHPNIDIRHTQNLTKSKWSPEDFRDKSTCINWQETTLDQIPGWDKKQLESILEG